MIHDENHLKRTANILISEVNCMYTKQWTLDRTNSQTKAIEPRETRHQQIALKKRSITWLGG